MNECNIARDLIPLQEEGLLSSDSVEFIRQHASRCPACSAILDRAAQGLPELNPRDAEAEKKRIRQALRRDRWKTAGKTLLAVLILMIPMVFYTFLTLREWGYFYPIEATYPSPDGSQILELVEPEHLFNPSDGYLIRFRLPKGYLNRYPTIWTAIEPHWAPDNTHLLLITDSPEDGPQIRIVDTTVMLTQGGTWEIPGMSENLIPVLTDLCKSAAHKTNVWTDISFSFSRWEENSELIVFRYETDLGQSGQITYHWPTQTLADLPW